MEEMEERGFVLPHRIESGAVYTALRRMEAHGLLESLWEKVESGPDKRIYTVTEEGVKALKTGLETMVKRETLMKDLVVFYDKHFQRQEKRCKSKMKLKKKKVKLPPVRDSIVIARIHIPTITYERQGFRTQKIGVVKNSRLCY
jgi:DNA-binding PadR family transcriptional regulator